MIRNSLVTISLLFIMGCGGGSSSSSSSDSVSSTIGKSGSLAQYAVVGDYLYTVNSGVMDILDISDASKPKKVSKVHLPWDVETLFAYKDYLYIGGERGVYIYDNSTPILPTSIAQFSHVQSCDPVVVSDDIAYVTLNTGSSCWNNRTDTNRLEILDVQDPKNPKLIKTLDMWSPTGLGVDGNKLFICDGESGLKAFEIDKSDTPLSVELDIKESNAEIDCYDVIAHNSTLIVSNRDDIRQFDYSSFPMEELGRIK
ncbi:MAG TPA: hypothetical protein EYM49_02030 [Campylobacterales bacterium]|nr:hypothetical protein [Campylobacterales bacterium]